MGGDPLFCLLSLALPGWADAWVDRYAGLLKLARAEAGIAGSDLARRRALTCDIVFGSVPLGSALRRNGARLGDEIYVSGRLGGSALGLATRRGLAWKRHTYPEPRLALGQYLRRKLGATAAMDLSDGLSIDLRRLAVASKVAAAIDPPPIFPGATLEQALHGGEDYELLFTVPSGTRVPARFDNLPLTRIGVIGADPQAAYFSRAPLAALGYDHFRRS
jgi:thiamine-monophosphate kinase